MPKINYTRVRDLETGNVYSVVSAAVMEGFHEVLDEPGANPDGTPRAPEYPDADKANQPQKPSKPPKGE